MEKLQSLPQFAEHIALTTLLNTYMRETANWSRYYHKPQYDPTIATLFETTGIDRWIKLPLENIDQEVFCALEQYSETGQHNFKPLVFARDNSSDACPQVSLNTVAELLYKELSANEEIEVNLDWDGFWERLENSEQNILRFLNFRQDHKSLEEVSQPALSFIQAEQSLLLGHAMHPFGKGRKGWTTEELIQYSPETQQEFRLAYLLADTSVVEATPNFKEISDQLRSRLLANGVTPETLMVLDEHKDKLLLPVHPWELKHLLNTGQLDELIEAKSLIVLEEELGTHYTATSSIRTVYSAEEDYMFKFSLNIQVTNSERVNADIELERGFRFHKLLKTDWGKELKANFPQFEAIDDPAYFQVKKDGEPIAGLNTIVRNNPFKDEKANKNVSMMASLSQGSIAGQPSRLQNLIDQVAEAHACSAEEAGKKWFNQYLEILLGNLVRIFNQQGLALEAHQQNTLLELTADGLPSKLFYRDNQGYFFRAGKAEALIAHMPSLADEEWALVPEEIIFPKFGYYLMVNNVLGMLNAVAQTKAVREEDLLQLLTDKLNELNKEDETGLVDFILGSRDWVIKSNLLTKLADMDEVLQPMDNPAVYGDMPNPLMLNYFSEGYMRPRHTDIMDERFFEEAGIRITIRPFDLKRDLPIVHEWFNEAHTKTFWKMDGPIEDLEKFYIELQEIEGSTAYMGEINGEPSFTFEPYWCMRDRIGRYYEALPDDHGIHLLIAPTDKNKKYTFLLTRALMSFSFRQKGVGKIIGEADINMRPMHMLVTRIGFKFQRVLELPYKTANLTFCTRESYLERFPDEQVYEEMTRTV